MLDLRAERAVKRSGVSVENRGGWFWQMLGQATLKDIFYSCDVFEGAEKTHSPNPDPASNKMVPAGLSLFSYLHYLKK